MKNIKPIIQNDLKDCGICCMQYIIICHGGYISLEKLREDTLTNINGTNAYNIVNAFKKWGFDSIGVLEYDISKTELKFPLIAHVILKNGLEHFVVVKYIKKDTVYLMDPSIGNKKMNLQEFNKIYSGHLIEAYPRNNIIKMENNFTIKDLFFRIVKKEKHLIIKIIFISILWTILSIICSYYLKIGSNIITENISIIKYLIFCFGILTLLKVFIEFIRNYYENHLSNKVDSYLYPDIIQHIFFLPLKSIKSRTTGEIITRINEISNIKSLFSDIFVTCFLDSLMMLMSMVILYIINSKLFFILETFILIYGIYGYFISKIMYKRILENIDNETTVNSVIIENIAMLDSIKNLNITNKILFKIEKNLAKYLFNNYNLTKFLNITSLGKDYILEICFFLINSFGIWYVYKGSISIIDLFTFNIILDYCIGPVKNIINLLPKFNYIKASFSKITEFLNIEEEKLSNQEKQLKGDIIFKNVSYSYNNYDIVVDKVNFMIKNGTHVLLNGKSGSGKSTICKLLYKENELVNGDIFIGNYKLKDLDINIIRNNILYVSQNEELFTGTIKENILVYRDVSDKYYEDVCKICEIEEIINKKGLRHNSLIENNTKNLSGGEKQRIILARGLLKDANIIILDEALSEVDKKLETNIIKKIRNYYNDRTIIYISHKNQSNNFENIINIGETT